MKRVACYSDLHGTLPAPVDCDFAIIAGDLCPSGSFAKQLGFLQGPFTDWLAHFRFSFFIAGNHDNLMAANPELVPRFAWNARYLNDSGFEPTDPMGGWLSDGPPLHVYGLPWSIKFGRWDFMCDESTMAEKLAPARSADILIVHGPPYGLGDRAYRRGEPGYERVGSQALLDHIDQHRPKLVVCGHIHEDRGIFLRGTTTIVNAANLNRKSPILIDLDDNYNVIEVPCL